MAAAEPNFFSVAGGLLSEGAASAASLLGELGLPQSPMWSPNASASSPPAGVPDQQARPASDSPAAGCHQQ